MRGLDHYLDDFSLVCPPQTQECRRSLDIALTVCDDVGFGVAPSKTKGLATQINLLGIVIDSVRTELRLPREKLDKLHEMVKQWRHRKSVSYKCWLVI